MTLELYPAITTLNGKLGFSCDLSTSAVFALKHAPEDSEAFHEIVMPSLTLSIYSLT